MKLLCILSLLALSLSGLASSPKFDSKRLIIKFKNIPGAPVLENAHRLQHLFGQLYVAHTSNLSALEEELRESELIEYVEKDYHSGRKSLPSIDKEVRDQISTQKSDVFDDPNASRVWSFRDASKHGISVEKAYKHSPRMSNKKIIVAVVDTGVDFNHEDLKAVMWTNKNEIPGNGIDDDENGYIDDIHGINTLSRDSEGRATGNMKDTHSHGTHVSGTIGAAQNNGKGMAGIASNVAIMGIRTVPNRGDEKDVDVIESFLYAAKHGARIINCSFGKDHNEGGMAVQETINHIGKQYGVLVIAAAGNSSRNIDRRLTYPASFNSSNLLVVASTTSRGKMSGFSNYGRKGVDVAAPGSAIYSTTPNNRYASMSGTSMASPTTAGVAAEMLSRYPRLTPKGLKQALIKSVTKVRRFNSKMVSGGRIDLYNALELIESVRP